MDESPGRAIAFVLVGVIMLGFMVFAWREALAQAHAFQRWSVVDATVLESRVVETRGQRGGARPHVRFEYVVGGRRYESERFGYIMLSVGGSAGDWASRQVQRYPAGARVKARVNPADPGEAFVSSEPVYVMYVFLAVLPAMAGLFPAMIAYMNRSDEWNKRHAKRGRLGGARWVSRELMTAGAGVPLALPAFVHMLALPGATPWPWLVGIGGATLLPGLMLMLGIRRWASERRAADGPATT